MRTHCVNCPIATLPNCDTTHGTRKFAESQGRLEKTDAIDCETIRDYAASLKGAGSGEISFEMCFSMRPCIFRLRPVTGAQIEDSWLERVLFNPFVK